MVGRRKRVPELAALLSRRRRRRRRVHSSPFIATGGAGSLLFHGLYCLADKTARSARGLRVAQLEHGPIEAPAGRGEIVSIGYVSRRRFFGRFNFNLLNGLLELVCV